uniref:Arrestin-like N-terminal domain-containing protein n=1 Tax=Mycena chlorophos TaxID=658473 RepID=A0ABQ0LYM6_MYCCL|nr:predicted protein [Mycena chlorophos]
MAPQKDSLPSVFTLCCPDTVRVAGETIEGHVELDLHRAQQDGVEDVSITLKGSVITTIHETNTDGSDTKHQSTIPLIDTTTSLWQRGAAFPLPGSHILDLPFEFQLPSSLPPSFHFAVHHHKVSINYTMEILGSRPGLLRKDRRITKTFAVLPAASPTQIEAKLSLKQGWVGPWKTTVSEMKVRQGLCGGFGFARLEVEMPKLHSFPRATPVPLQIMVETRTKPMLRTKQPFDKHQKPLFPSPPDDIGRLKLNFCRETKMLAHRRSATRTDSHCISSATAKAVTSPPAEWIPDSEHPERGVWKRSVQFHSTICLPFAPTFATETVQCKYYLRLDLPFPGRNNLSVYVPIRLDPVDPCPLPTDLNYALIPPESPPPMDADIPPTYLSAIEHGL